MARRSKIGGLASAALILARGAAQRAGYRSTDGQGQVIALTRPEAIFEHTGTSRSAAPPA